MSVFTVESERSTFQTEDFGDRCRGSLKVVSDWTTEGSSKTSKQIETEVAQSLDQTLADFKYGAATIFGGLKRSWPESILGAQREIANSVAMFSSLLASQRETSSVKPSGLVMSESTAAVSTALSMSAVPNFEESLL